VSVAAEESMSWSLLRASTQLLFIVAMDRLYSCPVKRVDCSIRSAMKHEIVAPSVKMDHRSVFLFVFRKRVFFSLRFSLVALTSHQKEYCSWPSEWKWAAWFGLHFNDFLVDRGSLWWESSSHSSFRLIVHSIHSESLDSESAVFTVLSCNVLFLLIHSFLYFEQSFRGRNLVLASHRTTNCP
jgi:hypothetical protein